MSCNLLVMFTTEVFVWTLQILHFQFLQFGFLSCYHSFTQLFVFSQTPWRGLFISSLRSLDIFLNVALKCLSCALAILHVSGVYCNGVTGFWWKHILLATHVHDFVVESKCSELWCLWWFYVLIAGLVFVVWVLCSLVAVVLCGSRASGSCGLTGTESFCRLVASRGNRNGLGEEAERGKSYGDLVPTKR